VWASGPLCAFLDAAVGQLDTNSVKWDTYGLARRQIQRGAQILPGRLHLWVQRSSVHLGAFHLEHLLVLGWRFLLGGQIRGLIAGERGRLELWAERQLWVRAQEMALRRLFT